MTGEQTELHEHSRRVVGRRWLQREINRRALQLAQASYERYRSALVAAVAEGAVDPLQLHEWVPPTR